MQEHAGEDESHEAQGGDLEAGISDGDVVPTMAEAFDDGPSSDFVPAAFSGTGNVPAALSVFEPDSEESGIDGDGAPRCARSRLASMLTCALESHY